MDASEQGNNGNHAADPFDEDSLSCLLEICDIFGESVIFPHVGQQYQVEIPPVETKSVLFQLRPISHDDAKMPVIDEFGIGLPIPVNWVQYADDNIKIKYEKEEFSNMVIVHGTEGSAHLRNNGSNQVDYKFNTRDSTFENQKFTGKHLERFDCKVEFLNSTHQDIHVACSANHVMGDDDQNDYYLSLPPNSKAVDFYPLPDLPTQSWSDDEKQSFLLGLYIFGKNLVQVKKFMETRKIGDVLSFYYGKFYRSDGYHRWSECRKIRNRRCIHGQRIFTGWRQQELLARISNSACKELQDTLLEAAKTFNEGRSTLENFVFKLKDEVGLQVLVDAIGIGKGAHDLTGVALDHVRTNPTIPLHPEIPVGRACSSLTSADIIKFLTGDFRLSKTRSNDLFWEAVWPRLLARGWHSEQPRDHGSLGFKNSLVFLVPGVKKFSKKRLVKGKHFFDSVSDVLSKVALDPKLLELDVEEGNGWDADANVYRNGSFNNPHYFYLYPRRPSCNSEHMKFTIVDTSLVQRDGSFKVIEVRSLPLGAISNYDPAADSQESTSESSSETEDSTDSSDDEKDFRPVSFSENKPEDNLTDKSDLSKTLIHFSNRTAANGYAPGHKGLVKLKDDKTMEVTLRSLQLNCSAPTIKRRKLTACSRGTDHGTCSVAKRIQQDKQQMNSKPGPIKSSDTLSPEASPFQQKTNLYQNSKIFDLNNLPPDADVAESSSNEFKAEDLLQSSSGKHLDEQPSTGIRRQSMRNRPPTAKALEALANGLLGTKRSWRPSNSTSRFSRKARKVYEEPVSSTLSMSVAETVIKDCDESARKRSS